MLKQSSQWGSSSSGSRVGGGSRSQSKSSLSQFRVGSHCLDKRSEGTGPSGQPERQGPKVEGCSHRECASAPNIRFFVKQHHD